MANKTVPTDMHIAQAAAEAKEAESRLALLNELRTELANQRQSIIASLEVRRNGQRDESAIRAGDLQALLSDENSELTPLALKFAMTDPFSVSASHETTTLEMKLAELETLRQRIEQDHADLQSCDVNEPVHPDTGKNELDLPNVDYDVPSIRLQHLQ